MPKRTTSHVVADIAVSAVVGAFSACGAACEIVHKDYGDDVFIQTCRDGLMDHNRIWVQVKGTQELGRYFSKSENLYKFRVPVGHVVKWIRSADLVVFVLWDTKRRTGVWAIPKNQLAGWECYFTSTTHVHLKLKPEDRFDESAAAAIGWLGRIDHYSNLISQAQIADYNCQLTGNDVIPTGPKIPKGQHLTQLPFILSDFFKVLSIMDESGLTAAFLSEFRDCLRLIRKSFDGTPENEIEDMAVILAILKQLQIQTGIKGCGIAASVLNLMSSVVSSLIRKSG
jgi:hypothetical protein